MSFNSITNGEYSHEIDSGKRISQRVHSLAEFPSLPSFARGDF